MTELVADRLWKPAGVSDDYDNDYLWSAVNTWESLLETISEDLQLCVREEASAPQQSDQKTHCCFNLRHHFRSSCTAWDLSNTPHTAELNQIFHSEEVQPRLNPRSRDGAAASRIFFSKQIRFLQQVKSSSQTEHSTEVNQKHGNNFRETLLNLNAKSQYHQVHRRKSLSLSVSVSSVSAIFMQKAPNKGWRHFITRLIDTEGQPIRKWWWNSKPRLVRKVRLWLAVVMEKPRSRGFSGFPYRAIYVSSQCALYSWRQRGTTKRLRLVSTHV